MNIVLTGFMASGKTVVGMRLAELLQMDFVDSDKEVEENEQMSIAEIFKKNGESYFRKCECKAISEIAKMDSCVIATGGGAVINRDNTASLKKNGIIVNLEVSYEIINERLGQGDATRPLSNGQDTEKLFAKFCARQPFYDDCDIKIKLDLNKDVDDVAAEIIEKLEDKYEGKIRSGR